VLAPPFHDSQPRLTLGSSVFSLLVNEWRIHPSTRPGSSLVEFSVSFKFKRFLPSSLTPPSLISLRCSPAYAAIAEALFMDLSRRMSSAFEHRFAVLHKAKANSV
jgi:ribosome-associated toxin RatA of RatAB toxin-antitoxin module